MSAAEMLRDEIDRRTRIDLEILSEIPNDGEAVIVMGTGADIQERGVMLPSGLDLPERADGVNEFTTLRTRFRWS